MWGDLSANCGLGNIELPKLFPAHVKDLFEGLGNVRLNLPLQLELHGCHMRIHASGPKAPRWVRAGFGNYSNRSDSETGILKLGF